METITYLNLKVDGAPIKKSHVAHNQQCGKQLWDSAA